MQSLSLVTLGVTDLAASNRFYQEGFGWTPVFRNEQIVFYQMNGLVFATFLAASLEEDMKRRNAGPGAMSLAHNLGTAEEVEAVMARLLAAGGTLLRAVDAPPHGGVRGYVADPDGHAWEVAWQPAFTILPDGRVEFGA